MTASLDLYLSKNKGDRKIVDSQKGETNKIYKRKKQKETLPVAPSNNGIKRDTFRIMNNYGASFNNS